MEELCVGVYFIFQMTPLNHVVTYVYNYTRITSTYMGLVFNDRTRDVRNGRSGLLSEILQQYRV